MQDDWKKSINPKRNGAEYFTKQTGKLRLSAMEYALFRNVGRSKQEKVMAEWSTWIRDFKESQYPVLRDAASNPDVTKLDRETIKLVRIGLKPQRIQEMEKNAADPIVKNRRITKKWLKSQHRFRMVPAEIPPLPRNPPSKKTTPVNRPYCLRKPKKKIDP